MKITPEMMRVLEYVEMNPKRTSSDISVKFQVNQKEAREMLNILVNFGLLKCEKRKSGGLYYCG